jgi:hypothetical protein
VFCVAGGLKEGRFFPFGSVLLYRAAMRLRWPAVLLVVAGACFTPPSERCVEPGLNCPAASCDGCIQPGGTCLAAASMSRSACGAPRAACQSCSNGAECGPGIGCFNTGAGGATGGVGGVTPSCSGCVVGGQCLRLEQTTQMNCGRNGRACASCAPTDFCNAGDCARLPGAGGAGVGGSGAAGGTGGSCSGCFLGSLCVPSIAGVENEFACGLNGAACVMCRAGERCSLGQCTQPGTGGTPGTGGVGGGQPCSGCVTPTGLCVPDPLSLSVPDACGRNGSMCANCRLNGATCQQGMCVGGGAGGTAGNGGAGGSPACSGCVTASGACIAAVVAFTSAETCGFNGNRCTNCRQSGQVCQQGVCTNAGVGGATGTGGTGGSDGGCVGGSQTATAMAFRSVNFEAPFQNPLGAIDAGVASSTLPAGGISSALRFSGFATGAAQVTLVVRGGFNGPPPTIRYRWGTNSWQPRMGQLFTGVFEDMTTPSGLTLDISFLAQNGATSVSVDDVALRLANGSLVRPTLVTSEAATAAWASPQNARQLDMQPTSPTDFGSLAISEQLTVSGWGLRVPTVARVVGLTVTVFRRGSRISLPINSAQDLSMTLLQGNRPVGANRALPGEWGGSMGGNPGMPAPFVGAVYGGPTDTWAAGLSAAGVNSADFGVGYSIRGTDFGGFGSPEVDAISLRVDWCE